MNSRRHFLKVLGAFGLVATSTKFIFDVGANLWKQEPYISMGECPGVDIPNSWPILVVERFDSETWQELSIEHYRQAWQGETLRLIKVDR